MPEDVAAPSGLHKSPHRHQPHLYGGRRHRPVRKHPPPRPHPIRRRIAGGILLDKPWTVATAAILAHLRGLHRRIRRARGSSTARRVIYALIRMILARIPVDLRGSPLQLLAQLGIEVSDRAAREAMRILAAYSVIVRLGSDHTPSRIRLLAAHRAAVARAETRRITPDIFAPDAELLGREPVQLWLITANGQRMEGCCADSDSPDVKRNARPEVTQNHDTLSSWMRSLPSGRWIRLAADLLARRGDRVSHVAHLTTAHARALLLADGRPAGARDVAALLRGLCWLAGHGHLEIRDGDLLPKARRHPDLEVMGIDAPPSAERASKAMQAHMDRCGVDRSDLLGREEARQLAGLIWWNRQREESRLSLQDRRKLLTGSTRPGPTYADAINAAPEGLKEQARFMRRDGFSAELRRRANEHLRDCAVSGQDARRPAPTSDQPPAVRCDVGARPVPSRGGEPERPRHDRHRGGPAGSGRRRDGQASAQLDSPRAQGRVLAAVPAPGARAAGRPGRPSRIPDPTAGSPSGDPCVHRPRPVFRQPAP